MAEKKSGDKYSKDWNNPTAQAYTILSDSINNLSSRLEDLDERMDSVVRTHSEQQRDLQKQMNHLLLWVVGLFVGNWVAIATVIFF